jgi:putative ABC transport system substrate-binding protein
VARAVQTLAGNVDAIYIPPDNTAHAALPVIGRLTKENKIPYYATVKDALAQGALATLSLDFYELGKESASLALSVLNGKDPATIPIEVNKNPLIDINAKVANSYGLDLTKFKSQKNVNIVN